MVNSSNILESWDSLIRLAASVYPKSTVALKTKTARTQNALQKHKELVVLRVQNRKNLELDRVL